MKKFIAIGVFASLMLTIFSINVFAQDSNKTAYQKKVHELAEKYYCIINYNTDNPKNLSFTDQYTMGIFTSSVYDAESYNGLMAYLILTKTNEMSMGQLENFKTRMTNDLKAASKLKNAADIQRDKIAEQKKKEREQREKDTQTDRGYIYAQIEQKFNRWNQRGEFEIKTDYEKRLIMKSKRVFDSLCNSEVKEYISTYKRKEFTVNTYNTESQQFPFEFEQWSVRSALDKNRLGYLKRTSTVSVPIQNAELFKRDYYSYKREIYKDACGDFRFNYYRDYVAFVNDYIYFRKIIFIIYNRDTDRNERYDADVPLNNCQDVILYADGMKINSPYLKGYSFNFNKYDRNCDWENCSEYFDDYNEYLISYNKGTQGLYDEINKKKQYAKYKDKNYFADYNEFSSYYDQGEEVFNKKVIYESFKHLFKDYDEYSMYYDKGMESFENELHKRNYYANNKDFFKDYNEFSSFYDQGTDVFFHELGKRTDYKTYKEYFKDYNEYSMYYDKGFENFLYEIGYRAKCKEVKTIFPANANLYEDLSPYKNDDKKIDEVVSAYKQAKEAYLKSVFDNKTAGFYSTFVKYYIKGSTSAFKKEISRIYSYKTYGNLYNSESEFNEIFNVSDTCCSLDIAVRQYVNKYAYNIKKLSEKDYKTLVTAAKYNYDHGVVSTMEKVINGDSKMKKEFESNSSYFSDTKEFFNSYIGENYKAVLKEKKKAAKK